MTGASFRPAHLEAPLVLGILWLITVAGAVALMLRPQPRVRATGWLLLMVALASGSAFVLAHRELAVGNRGDVWFHLAATSETAAEGVFPGDAFFPGLPTPPQYSLLHVLQGALVRAWDFDPAVLWTLTTMASLGLRFLAVYLLAARLLSSRSLAMIAAAMSLFVPAGESLGPFDAARPFVLAISFMLLSQWALLGLLDRHVVRIRTVLVPGALLGVCIAFHLLVGLIALGATVLAVVVYRLLDRLHLNTKSIGSLGSMWVLALLIGSPWILNAGSGYAMGGVGGHGEWYHSVGRPFLGIGSMTVASLSPVVGLCGGWGIAVLAAVGGMAASYRALRSRDAHAAFLASGFVALLILVFTPLFGFVEKYLGNAMAPRMVAVMRPEILVVVGLVACCRASKTLLAPMAWLPHTVAEIGIIGVLAAATFWAGKPFTARMIYLARRHACAQEDHAFFKNHPAIKAFVSGTVVLADRWTSYRARYYFLCKAVVVPRGHGNPYAAYQAREQLVSRVLAGRLGDEETGALRARFPFSYVLVNRRLASQVDMEPRELGRIRKIDEERLARSPLVELRYDTPDFGLYAVRPTPFKNKENQKE